MIVNLKNFHQKYHQFFPVTFFILGFLLDVFTIGRIDDWSNPIIFLFYILVSLFLYFGELNNTQNYIKNNRINSLIVEYRSELFHFFQGALLSAFFLFFFKSSSGFLSFLCVLVVFLLLILNETDTFKKYTFFVKPTLLVLTTTSFIVSYIPIILGGYGPVIFLTSLLFSFITSFLIYKYLFSSDLYFFKISSNLHGLLIFLYLIKAIPPVPIHIQSIGAFNQVEKKYPEYHLTYLKKSWKFWQKSSSPLFLNKEEEAFVFTKVFAPKRFDEKIVIKWYVYNDGWKLSDTIPLQILGGRDAGFRGYVVKKNWVYGEQKVEVQTKGGLLIGNQTFSILPTVEGSYKAYKLIDL